MNQRLHVLVSVDLQECDSTFVFFLYTSSLFPLHCFVFVSYSLASYILRPHFRIIVKSFIIGLLHFSPFSSIGSLDSSILKNNFSCESHSVCPCNNTVTKLFSPLFMYRRDLNLLFVKNEENLLPRKNCIIAEG